MDGVGGVHHVHLPLPSQTIVLEELFIRISRQFNNIYDAFRKVYMICDQGVICEDF